MHLSVIGCGYVGLGHRARASADAGHDVICTDIDTERIDKLESRDSAYLRATPRHHSRFRARSRPYFLHFRCRRSHPRGRRYFHLRGHASQRNRRSRSFRHRSRRARRSPRKRAPPNSVIEKSTVPARTGLELQRALGAYSRNGGSSFAWPPIRISARRHRGRRLPPSGSHRRRRGRRFFRRAVARKFTPHSRTSIPLPGAQGSVSRPARPLLFSSLPSTAPS